MSTRLSKLIYNFMDNYNTELLDARATLNFKRPLGDIVRHDIPELLSSCLDKSVYTIKGSVGAGRWTDVPWISIFDNRITRSAQKGIYIVYLLNKDTKELFLTLNQGATNVAKADDTSKSSKSSFSAIAKTNNEKTTINLKKEANRIRQRLNCDLLFGDINTGSSAYDAGCIYYKKYELNSLPDDEILYKDLLQFITAYNDYYTLIYSANNWWPSIEEYTPGFSKEDWLSILNTPDLIGPVWGGVLAMFYTEPEGITCSALAKKFNDNPSSISGKCTQLAKRIQKKTNCPVMQNEENTKYWPIIFLGRDSSEEEDGVYIWKLRQELYDALTEFGIEKYLPHQTGVFDSWEIVDEVTAIKNCDKSFFEHNGSGVPKGICWFFEADECNPGDRIDITFEYEGIDYSARVSNESTDRRRVRVFWSSELGNKFKANQSIEGIKLKFIKTSSHRYQVSFTSIETNAWLLTWNPKNWEWSNFDVAKSIIENNGDYIDEWACSNSHAKLGDRVFMTMLGMDSKNGIFASGIVAKEPYQGPHYDEEKKKQGITIQKINVKFDVLLDYKKEEILSQNELVKMFPEQRWNPQGSGIEIIKEYRNQLEEIWTRFTKRGSEKTMTTKDIVKHISDYISCNGFTYPSGLIENFYLSLKSKPFVILAGTSGTGKTRLVRLFAESIGAEYKLVPVRPDWSDSSDLFGHMNLNDEFVSGAIIDFIKAANDNPNKPYILCLDEMNLARVEYYLSDFLSIIETRDMRDGTIITDPLITADKYGKDEDAKNSYGELLFPENLYVVGTVNMDETTFPFSKKVLDRANTIEFNYVDLLPSQSSSEAVEVMSINNDFLKSQYLKLVECSDEDEFINSICYELQAINQILQKANLHIGYRVRDEIAFYLINNKKADDIVDYSIAFDNQLLQKILPRIQGSSESIRKMLCELFKLFAGDYSKKYGDSDSEKMMKVLEDDKCKYPKSAAKIQMMISRFEDDGFTSYWL